MDEHSKELIAIGASVGAHCQPCLNWHVAKARELGIDDDAISEAIEVGHRVEKGAMSAMRKYSSAILAQTSDGKDDEPCEALKAFGVGDKT
jgi:AhpD family alkylhydroperoxidase